MKKGRWSYGVNLFLFFVLCLSGCSSDECRRRELEQMRAEKLKTIDVDACHRAGGSIEGYGMFGMPHCSIPYDDAGMSCFDSAVCEGICMIWLEGPGDKEQGEKSPGQCQATDAIDGCFAEILGGIVQGARCYD